MKWLDSVPFLLLVPLALYMAVAPVQPEPHLVQKLRMLSEGTLSRPLDVFDLFWHAAPLVLLGAKLVRFVRRGSQSRASSPPDSTT